MTSVGWAVSLCLFAVMQGNVGAEAEPAFRVADSSVEIRPSANGRGLRVNLRLLEATPVREARAEEKAAQGPIPVEWTSFQEATPKASCAWLIVIDCSNPARQRTVAACAEEVRSFLDLLPKGDAVMLASLARDLVTMAPFEATPAQRETALANMKAEGDRSLTSLIYQNVKHALDAHLSGRPEARKCVVLLTDGKDETPGGPLKGTERRNELIAEARRLGIAVHTLGFAERATEATFFAELKEVSLKTDGLHFPAEESTRQLPADTWSSLIGVMHSGGTAALNLADMKVSAELRLELTGDNGRNASVVIPHKVVKEVVPDAPTAGVPKTQTVPRVEATGPAISMGIGWTVGGVILLLLLLLLLKARSRMRPNVQVKEEVQPKTESPPEEISAVPLIFLQVVNGGTQRYAVTAKGVKIGSGGHNDIVIQHDSVSADHCLVSLQNGEWVVADTGSKNGLRVNGTYYHQASLNPEDEIEIGEVKIRFLSK